ncbi:MAG: matrixin family metalloprotease [bacterium]|nr:matrixin family metalloprotease [bacterium]
MKLRHKALLFLLGIAIGTFGAVSNTLADDSHLCSKCGTVIAEESPWNSIVNLENKATWESALAEKRMCFYPGTPDETIDRLTSRVYENAGSYISGNRWTSTANGTAGGQGDPTILTYSFVPDGVTVPDADFGNQPNNINAMMTAKFGSVANGKLKFRQAFNQWQALSGITYVEEPTDDGAALFTSPGVLGVRGDIRISAISMDGIWGVLAYNWFPNTGDMVLDNAENWQDSFLDYRYFRNVVTHEAGHGFGLYHVCPDACVYLMEPYICTDYNGPQHDDIRGVQRLYGDSAETNDSPGTATSLGSPANGTTTITGMSIDDNSDQDYYAFTVPVDKQITITVTPVGAFFQQCAQTGPCTCAASDTTRTTDDVNLSLRLYNTNGTTVMAEASANGAGIAETIPNTGLPAAGTYYIRVYQGTTNAVQLYTLSFTISNANVPTVTVTQPNGGQVYSTGSSQTITWTSANITGNVNIELNRDYPGGAWESVVANTANDGTQAWTPTAPITQANCRIRVTSINSPAATDESDASFTVFVPDLVVVRPNGGEVLAGAAFELVSMTTSGVTGLVNVELNRSYPAGSWTLIGSVPNTGGTLVFGGPSTTTARVRLTSVNEPVATDTSDANFEIVIINNSPVIAHDPHGDQEPGTATFTALVTDDGGPLTCTLFSRVSGGGAFASVNMPVTGNPDEFAGSFAVVEGAFEYFIRATDGTNTVNTDTISFDVEDCPAAIVFDDGTAEGYNWAEEPPFAWAVKYTPTGYPFLLCGFQVAVAKTHPDAEHSPITGRVLLADGIGGLPGSLIFSEVSGSVGNVIGGLPAGQVAWATVSTLDGAGAPLVLGGPFFVAVDNPVGQKYEAFGRDDQTISTNSYFYDGCDSLWYSENDAVPNAQGGQRMIRLLGAAIPAPTDLVIVPNGDDIVLYWAGSGAPYYRILSATTTGGPFTTLEGSTTGTTFTDVGASLTDALKFYVVVSSATP